MGLVGCGGSGESPEGTGDASASPPSDAAPLANDATSTSHDASDAAAIANDAASGSVDASEKLDASLFDAGRGDADAGATDSSATVSDAAADGGFDPCAHAKPCVIMPLGDSITYGYGSTVSATDSTTGGGYRVELFALAVAAKQSITFVGSQTDGPPAVDGQTFPPENEGHSGYSIDDSSATSGISPLVDHAIATYKPNIILLMIGTNDMHYSIDLPNAPTRLGNLLDQITTDAPGALVVVAQIIAAHGAQNTPTLAYNAAIPAVVSSRVAEGKHLALVDMYSALGPWSTTLWHDSEHPNNAGYILMGKAWYPAIQSVLPAQ